MGQRLQLQDLLETLADHVYAQRPANVSMKYPCIVYSLNNIDTKFAGNKPYRLTDRYQVTVIDSDVDSPIRTMVAELPLCSFQRSFVADNLYHFVFNLYF